MKYEDRKKVWDIKPLVDELEVMVSSLDITERAKPGSLGIGYNYTEAQKRKDTHREKQEIREKIDQIIARIERLKYIVEEE